LDAEGVGVMSRDRRSWRGDEKEQLNASESLGAGSTPADASDLPSLLSLGLEAISETGDAFYEWSLSDDTLTWAENVSLVLGVASAKDISSGRSYAARLVSQKGTSRYEAIVSQGLRDNGAGVEYQIEYAIRNDRDEEIWVEDRGRWFGDAEGRPRRAIGLVRVITSRRRRDEELTYLAANDELTGHLNRMRLKEVLSDSLLELRRVSREGAYLVVAIDNLALVNEAYGFDVADQVIVEVGKRLLGVLRSTDVIGRCSGNKFGIILRNCSDEQMCASAERLLSAVHDMVIEIDAGPVATTVSIGCVSLPSNADSAQMAMMRAEEALAEAKHSRRASYVPFRHSAEKEHKRRGNIKLADELVAALNERRLTLAFQPLVASQTLEPVLHEALLRLKQRDGAIVSAWRFIPIAEKLGLIRLIDHRVLELAFEDLLHGSSPQIAINVSGYTITDKVWLDMFVALCSAHPSAAERLVVEITETVAIEEISESQQFVATVRGQGAKVAIDDFGAGYTSFRNLKCLSVDMVKIDGTFVEGLSAKPDNQMFLRTFVDLARNFGLPTVAECVSGEDEVKFLRDIGVEYLQGFHLGEPVMVPPWRDSEVALTPEEEVERARQFFAS
jgi:diguanylate cyclase (GGDEF)-like protein